MGKIFDALEKHKRDKAVKEQFLHPPRMEAPSGGDEETLTRAFSPDHRFSHKLVAVSAPDSVDAENFKVLRANILFSRNRPRPRTIMVTSTLPAEGKTFVAGNLAASIALGIDEYVLLVDADLRQPSLHQLLGYGKAEGLHEYLTGRKRLDELIIRTEIEKLSLLLGGKNVPNPAELLSSSAMEDFLKEVSTRYKDRFIVIDSTPSQVTAEANVLANFVDGIVLVVRTGRSPREAVKRTINNLGKEKILGVVFNGYTQARKDYNRYYTKYYKSK